MITLPKVGNKGTHESCLKLTQGLELVGGEKRRLTWFHVFLY